uniref:Uncharacterized protein n=1 Tax=Amphimedon queenslandica TaxID=400682 RepID=A0A1X7VBM8_AMPQE
MDLGILILENAEFGEVDATFRGSIGLEYLLNMIFFAYIALSYVSPYNKWIFTHTKENIPGFDVGKILKGFIADWFNTQMNGLKLAIGEGNADKVVNVKGCQVHY